MTGWLSGSSVGLEIQRSRVRISSGAQEKLWVFRSQKGCADSNLSCAPDGVRISGLWISNRCSTNWASPTNQVPQDDEQLMMNSTSQFTADNDEQFNKSIYTRQRWTIQQIHSQQTMMNKFNKPFTQDNDWRLDKSIPRRWKLIDWLIDCFKSS